MRLALRLAFALILASALAPAARAVEDQRQLVELPVHMQHHMLASMRDHLVTVDRLLALLADGQGDAAADLAEAHLGMSSLQSHGAAHMARFMPQAMQDIGTEMHHAASRFARVAREGDTQASYAALQKITANCVACHAGYRIR